MKKVGLFLMIGIFFMLSACAEMTASPTAEMAELAFDPTLTMFESGKIHFELGIANMAGPDQPMVDDVDIQAVVTNEDGDIRNRMTIVDLPSIPAGESKSPLTYEAVYEPGKYVMSITGEGIPSLAFPFEVREVDGLLKLAAHPDYIDPHTGFTIDDRDL